MTPTETIAIASAELAAEISATGAELTRLLHRGRTELLWGGDARYWALRSPILFPVAGRVAGDAIRIGGRTYPMPLHGFAHDLAFEAIERTPASCRLALRSSPVTERHFPFPFRLELSYAVEGARLIAEATIKNPGATLLPASFGFHPGFRWPLEPNRAKHDYHLSFLDDSELEFRRPADGLTGTATHRIILENGRLPLDEALFGAGAMILLAPRSRRLRYGAARGGLALTISVENLPNLVLWMRPGADFLCIEPWRGYPDPEGSDGDFLGKPGLQLIEAGSAAMYRMTVGVEGDGKKEAGRR